MRRAQLRHARAAAGAGAILAVTLSLGTLAPVASADDRNHGERWETVTADTLHENASINSVSASGTDRAWSSGTRWIDGMPDGVMLTWRHGAWREDTAPGLPDVDTWYSVAAAGRHDVWAYGWSWLGEDPGEALAHYDGRSWEQVALPDNASHTFGELAAVPGRIWLAGDQRLSTYARGTWQTTELPTGRSVRQVHARSANDAWAVGADYAGLGADPVALHWDGRAWRDVSPTLPGLRLTDVYVESARSVWATATSADDWFTSHVLHWDGRTWRDTSGPVTGIEAQAVSADGHGRAWMAGNPEGWEGPPLYWRYDGHRWTRVAGPAVPDGITQSYEVTALAPIARTGRFWSVGSFEFVDGTTAHPRDIIQRSRY
ncbi:hypothetical protein [Streptomyces mayteni]